MEVGWIAVTLIGARRSCVPIITPLWPKVGSQLLRRTKWGPQQPLCLNWLRLSVGGVRPQYFRIGLTLPAVLPWGHVSALLDSKTEIRGGKKQTAAPGLCIFGHFCSREYRYCKCYSSRRLCSDAGRAKDHAAEELNDVESHPHRCVTQSDQMHLFAAT